MPNRVPYSASAIPFRPIIPDSDCCLPFRYNSTPRSCVCVFASQACHVSQNRRPKLFCNIIRQRAQDKEYVFMLAPLSVSHSPERNTISSNLLQCSTFVTNTGSVSLRFRSKSNAIGQCGATHTHTRARISCQSVIFSRQTHFYRFSFSTQLWRSTFFGPVHSTQIHHRNQANFVNNRFECSNQYPTAKFKLPKMHCSNRRNIAHRWPSLYKAGIIYNRHNQPKPNSTKELRRLYLSKNIQFFIIQSFVRRRQNKSLFKIEKYPRKNMKFSLSSFLVQHFDP